MSSSRKLRRPRCRHVPSGRVSWPVDLTDVTFDKPHASIYCCHREGCIADAAAWVEAHTGTPGQFRPFERTVAP